MRADVLYNYISNIDSALLKEAEEFSFKERRRKHTLMWTAVATACILLCSFWVYAAVDLFSVEEDELMDGLEVISVNVKVSKIPLNEIKGEVNEASEIIKKNHENTEDSELVPNIYSRDFDSLQEALNYVGYDKARMPNTPLEDTKTSIWVNGQEDGRINEICITNYKTYEYKHNPDKKVFIKTPHGYNVKVPCSVAFSNQIYMITDAYTENEITLNYSKEMFGDSEEIDTKEITTQKGITCLILDSPRKRLGSNFIVCFITIENVIYVFDVDYTDEGRFQAIELIKEWANGFE